MYDIEGSKKTQPHWFSAVALPDAFLEKESVLCEFARGFLKDVCIDVSFTLKEEFASNEVSPSTFPVLQKVYSRISF